LDWIFQIKEGGNAVKPRVIIILLLVILAIVFIVQNTRVVSVDFLFLKFQMSQIIMIVLMLLIGFFIGYLAAVKKK
jgi:uncharacterized integral membrane protein